MAESEKTKLTLSVNSKIVQKARDNPDINISEITEKVLRAFTASSEIKDKEKIYESYQELFGLMLPLLRKFKVRTKIAYEVLDWGNPQAIGWDEEGVENDWDAEPTEWCDYYLQHNGKIFRESDVEIEIKDIKIEDFFRPQDILDKFLDSIQEGVNYRKEQFAQIEMAKTIIDAITKGVIPKTKSKGKGR